MLQEQQKEKNVLYFSDLPINIIQNDLEMFLEEYKDKIRLINLDQNQRNLELHKPLNAKVIFIDYESANKCRLEMNLKKIKGHSVRIMWDEKDNSIRYNTKSNLYFKGIPLSIPSRKVYEYFMKFGDISSLKLMEDENGNHFGYGYITFYNPDDAQKAILETNGKKVFDDNNIIEIEHFKKKMERNLNNFDSNYQKIFINNFKQNLSEDDLNKFCSKYGQINSCKIFKDEFGRNYAIVEYLNKENANSALQNLPNEIPNENNLKLHIELYQNKYERKQLIENKIRESNYKLNLQYHMCNLHIRNIPLTATEEDLKNAFSKYGNIVSVKIEKFILETGEKDSLKEILKSKGFGYVCFDNPESAKNAMLSFNGKYLPSFESWNRPLLIEYFMPKAERQILNNQYMNNNMGGGMYYYNQPMLMRPNFPMYNPRNYNKRGRHNNRNNNNYQNRNNNNNNYKNQNNNNNNNNNYNNNNYNNNNNISNNNNNNNKKNDERTFDFEAFNKLENDDAKREFLGEQIFKAIENSPLANENKMNYDIIGRITGMILGIPDINEVIDILQSESALNSRIKEGYDLIIGNEQK